MRSASNGVFRDVGTKEAVAYAAAKPMVARLQESLER